MRVSRWSKVPAGMVLAAALAGVPATAGTWEQRSGGERALYSAAAVVANAVPGASALVVPRCLPGYVLCKLSFAGLSVLAAAESLVMSGGADYNQPRAILERGFGGDWALTGRHVAGDEHADVYPEVQPPAGAWADDPSGLLAR